MLLIWGVGQCRSPAAQWHDGQFTHDAYARFARRAKSADLFAVALAAQDQSCGGRAVVPLKEYTFAWLQKVRECSRCDHPWHPAVWRGPWLLRTLLAGAHSLVARTPVLAADPVVRQPIEALSIPRSDFPRTGAWLPRIEQCPRCKARLELPWCINREPRK
jgi:hypothetical protein